MLNPLYPLFGDADGHPDNKNNPYGYKVADESQGETYFNAVDPNSTMVSDSVEMTNRLHRFVPKASMREGRVPARDLMTLAQLNEENNKGSDYKSKYIN